MMSNIVSINEAIRLLQAEQVIAYPTESIYGLGCDPDSEAAVKQLLHLKHRSITKGLILIAGTYAQLQPYINENALTETQKAAVMTTWPGAVTWVFPKNKTTPTYLTGKFDTLAVRVTQHPVVKVLCAHYGKPLVSTSANCSGDTPCRSPEHVAECFGEIFPIVEGCLGENAQPSQIRDSRTGKIIRY